MTDGWWCTLCICMLQDCLQNVIAVCVKPGVSRVLPEKCPPRQGNNLKREPCEAVQALRVGPKHVPALLGYSWTFLESSNVWGSWPHRLQVGSDTLLTRPCKPVVQWNSQTSVWPRSLRCGPNTCICENRPRRGHLSGLGCCIGGSLVTALMEQQALE